MYEVMLSQQRKENLTTQTFPDEKQGSHVILLFIPD